MTVTTNVRLTKPARGDSNWGTTLNNNFDSIDSLIGNIHADLDIVPETYIYNGTFDGPTTGEEISLPRTVDSVNDYACKVTATSRAGAIGDIWITKATDKVTVYCSEANSTDSFSVTISFIGSAFNNGISVHRKWYVSPSGETETDHGDSSVDGTLADIIVNDVSGEQASIELPGRHSYQLRQSLVVPDNVELSFQKGAVIDTDVSIRDGNYEWYLSGGGVGEYYLQALGGGNPGINSPDDLIEDGTQMTVGSPGSLVSGEWAWTDQDSLTYTTVYACIDGNVDPDTKAANYLQAGYDLTISGEINAGSFQIFSGDGTVTIVSSVLEHDKWKDGTGESILPSVTESIDLGSPTQKFNTVYLNSLNIFDFPGLGVRPKFTWGGLSGEIDISSGVYYHAGTKEQFVYWTSPITYQFSCISGEQFTYLYLDDPAIVASGSNIITTSQLSESYIAPDAWSDSKMGRYSGESLCIFAIYCKKTVDLPETEEFFHDGGNYLSYGGIVTDYGSLDPGTDYSTQVTLSIPAFCNRATCEFRTEYIDAHSTTNWRNSDSIRLNQLTVGEVDTNITGDIVVSDVFCNSSQSIDIKNSSGNNEVRVRTLGWYFPNGM